MGWFLLWRAASPQQPHLHLQLHAGPGQHPLLHLVHQGQHIGAGGPAPVDHKAGVLLRHLGPPHRQPPQAALVDEGPGKVPRRPLEHGAGAGPLQGLLLPPAPGKVLHPGGNLLPVPLTQGEHRPADQQLPAGKATPGPPVGSTLGPHGINIPGFTKEFNAKTAGQEGLIIPVVMTIYQDRSFTFVLKTPPAPVLIKKALGLETASATPNKVKVGKLTKAQVEEIAKQKMPDLNCTSLESAISMIKGTARSMGVTVEE